MKNLRNVIFYVVGLSVFAVLMYMIVIAGEPQEALKVTKDLTPPATSAFDTIKETLHHNVTHPLAILLLQIITIIVTARVFGFLCKKIGQPSVIGEIIAGIFLGPSFIGMYFPEFSGFLFPKTSLGNLQFLSQIGLVLFMFIVGMELDLKMLKK